MLAGAVLLLLGAAVSNPAMIQLAVFFPMGLFAAFATPKEPFISLPLLIVAYIGYFFFLLAFMRARLWSHYSFICIMFACVLLLNVAGCHEELKSFHGPE